MECKFRELRQIGSGQTGVNIDILGIIKLRWTGKGEFNSDDHYIYYFGQESLRRNGVAIIAKNKKESKMQYLDAISKMTQLSVCFLNKPFNITVIQVYAPNSNTEEAEVEQFYEDLLEHPKKMSFSS